jgi:ferrochelatase
VKTGILLIQLGSPKSPSVPDVKKFLREFLSDPRLIPYQNLGWKLLLELVILPKRSPKSAEAYSSIFKDGVSPLISFTESFAKKVSEELI